MHSRDYIYLHSIQWRSNGSPTKPASHHDSASLALSVLDHWEAVVDPEVEDQGFLWTETNANDNFRHNRREREKARESMQENNFHPRPITPMGGGGQNVWLTTPAPATIFTSLVDTRLVLAIFWSRSSSYRHAEAQNPTRLVWAHQDVNTLKAHGTRRMCGYTEIGDQRST